MPANNHNCQKDITCISTALLDESFCFTMAPSIEVNILCQFSFSPKSTQKPQNIKKRGGTLNTKEIREIHFLLLMNFQQYSPLFIPYNHQSYKVTHMVRWHTNRMSMCLCVCPFNWLIHTIVHQKKRERRGIFRQNRTYSSSPLLSTE